MRRIKFLNFPNTPIFYKNWIFIATIFLLPFICFWKVLSFEFFQDDYYFLWNAIYNPFVQIINFRHPGIPIEAFLLVPFFGLHQIVWEILGILLKGITAYLISIFLYKLTNSTRTGVLAGLFFAISYAGISIVGAFNYHGPAQVAIPLLIALIYLVKSIREDKKHFWKFVIFLIFAILPDPARTLPIFVMLPFFFFLFPMSKNMRAVQQFLLKFILVFFAVGIPLLATWYVVFSIGKGTQLEMFIKRMHTNPQNTIVQLKYVGNFFATMTNLFTEVVYGLQANGPGYETANYTRSFGIIGIGILLAGITSLFYYFRRKSRFFLLISFFIFWIYVFYLPNWLAEPRVSMTSQNHYLFLSSIGYICLIAYILSFIKKQWLLIVMCVSFILLNIYKDTTTLSLEFPYRSAATIDSTWHTVSKDVVKTAPHDIFLFTGNIMWLSNSIIFDGAYYFLLLKNDSNISDLPQLTFDETLVFDRLCSPTKRVSYYNSVISYSQVALSNIFAWEEKSPGILVNRTQQEREKLLLEAQQKNCHLLKQ